MEDGYSFEIYSYMTVFFFSSTAGPKVLYLHGSKCEMTCLLFLNLNCFDSPQEKFLLVSCQNFLK